MINNSTLGELQLSGASAVVTKVTGTGRATIGADEMTISDDGFAGLSVEGTGDVALEMLFLKFCKLSGGSEYCWQRSGNSKERCLC